MLTIQTMTPSTVLYPNQEININYRGKTRYCRIERIERAAGYIVVFDITSNGYRTFQINKIGK